MKIVEYNFSLYELLVEYGLDEGTPWRIASFSDYIDDVIGIESNLPKYPITLTDQIIDELWQTVYARYGQHVIVKVKQYLSDVEPTTDSIIEEGYLKKWFYKYLNMLKLTYSYYSTILELYNNNATKLLDDLKTTSSVKMKFNDTPQNAGAGTYVAENYLTTYTENTSESSSPIATIIQRLKEIQENYRDMMSEWVNKFERIFYEEEGE